MEEFHEPDSLPKAGEFNRNRAFLLMPCCLRHLAAYSGKFRQNRTGMTQVEVTAILGEPTESFSADVAVFSGTASTWKKDGTIITIQFANGKVGAKQFSKEKNV
ncbi:MAG: hypothetical protein WCD80_05745 [Desulfobaccales bacterium]